MYHQPLVHPELVLEGPVGDKLTKIHVDTQCQLSLCRFLKLQELSSEASGAWLGQGAVILFSADHHSP